MMTLTNDNFEELVQNSSVPVLVDFWASWCGPCRMVSPLVDEIAEQADGFAVGKINIDEQPELAAAYGVMSIPTLMVFKGGEVVDKAVGARPKAAILAMVNGAK